MERRVGIDFQRRLIDAMRRKDAGEVKAIMYAHMQHAEASMLALEATLEERFLSDSV